MISPNFFESFTLDRELIACCAMDRDVFLPNRLLKLSSSPESRRFFLGELLLELLEPTCMLVSTVWSAVYDFSWFTEAAVLACSFILSTLNRN